MDSGISSVRIKTDSAESEVLTLMAGSCAKTASGLTNANSAIIRYVKENRISRIKIKRLQKFGEGIILWWNQPTIFAPQFLSGARRINGNIHPDQIIIHS
jgi:glutaredoxin-related protein